MMLNKQIKTMAKVIFNTFNPEFVKGVAQETGFQQRTGKLKPEAFLVLCTLLKNSIGKNSLPNLCSAIGYQFKTSISKQALNERFNAKAVSFLKKMYHQLSDQQEGIPSLIEKHALFSRIRIMDATSFRLPKDYEDYPGIQGNGVKVQLEYEYLEGKFLYHSVDPETRSDKDAARELIKSERLGDLILRDLGFYSASIINEIFKSEASLITRVPSQTKFWTGNPNEGWTQIKPEEDLKDEEPGEIVDYGFIKVGGDKRSSVMARVVAQKLTADQRKSRDRALKLKRQKGHQTLSAQERNNIQILVTNITQENLEAQDLYPLYTLRWQIEILFKTWKSLFEVDEVRKMKQERFECHLYGTLIEILLSSMLAFQCRLYLYRDYQLEASEYKCIDLAKEALPHLITAVQTGKENLITILEILYENARKHGKKDHRKSHVSPFDVLGIPYK
ncbi:transposase [Pontibacillus chungwhensis BH030062]|uniref:Transposase n=1 Tax=Pontibacillus chungwhensis BH030062 TaxID=1385513 RepID=A0A0A2UW35_9BACI|nr:IS4 family transposase [Pontibacillus chungwhensis]KGP92502.1 transposase [Pontibacillus chungwhensis BH030062]